MSDAIFCKECGATLSHEPVQLVRGLGPKPLIAAALSIIPGFGHLYRGRPLKGLLWFLGVWAAYTAPPLGYILHLVCAANAAMIGVIRDDRIPRASRRERSRAWSGP